MAFCQTSLSDSKPVSQAIQARDYDRAIALNRAALQQTPLNSQVWTFEGIAYESKGDNHQALAAFQCALSISPNNIAALLVPLRFTIEREARMQCRFPVESSRLAP